MSARPCDNDAEVREAHLGALLAKLARLESDDPERAVTRDQIIESYLPAARHVAARFRHRGEPEDDLVQVARVGLIHAVDRFDPSRGRAFLAFAIPTMMGEVRRYFRDSGWSVHVPRRLQELHLQVDRAAAELTQRHGRPPTPDHIAAYLSCPVEHVHEGLDVGAAYQSLSLNRTTGSSGDGPPLGELIPMEDHALDGLVDREALRPLLAELPDRERRILYLRFFRSMSQTQIGADVGISQMQVSRVLFTTLEHLRRGLAGLQ